MRVRSWLVQWGLTGALACAVLASGFEPATAADKPAEKERYSSKAPAVKVEPSLSPGTKLDALALAAHIDKLIGTRLKADKIEVSPRCDDAEFLRRAYLDLTGQIPTVEQATTFLDNKDADKRRKLIDDLLSSAHFGRHQSDIWEALMVQRGSDLRAVSFDPLIKWLEKSFNDNKPWDKAVHELITASGDQDANPAILFTVGQSNMNRFAIDKMNDTVAKVFLGIQLQCAQCHNHPFTDWKQSEYWGMAAFFMKVSTQAPRNGKQADIKPTVEERPNARQGKNALPESAKIVPAKFLQGAEPKIAEKESAREVLARWVCSADNPFFAKAMVNRTWSELFGRGFVTPVDDMHDGNPASHPVLLADLAQQFAANGFDVKYLFRAICNSEAYQRSSKPTGNNGSAASTLFARMNMKVLTPEQLYDSFTVVMGPPAREDRGGLRAAVGRGIIATPRGAFVAFFGLEDGADPTEFQTGIPQVLRLMNSNLSNSQTPLGRLVQSEKVEKNVEQLYLATVNRRPSDKELESRTAYVKKAGTAKEGYADLLWALVNCSEFQLNR